MIQIPDTKQTFFFFVISAGSEELGDLDSLDGHLPAPSAATSGTAGGGGGHRSSSLAHQPDSAAAAGEGSADHGHGGGHHHHNGHSHGHGHGGHGHSGHGRPLPPPSPPLPPSGFTKGPASKNKRHRKLNRESVRLKSAFYTSSRASREA